MLIVVSVVMKTKTLQLFIMVLFVHMSWAQKINNLISFRDIDSESYFRFNYDNDYFAATDENYTQGYSFELVIPALMKNPINKLFLKPKYGVFKYGVSVEHIGFTPNDYVSSEIQFGDRPFAAVIMLKSFGVVTNSSKGTRLSQSLSLGLMGAGAFGKEMQVGIHEATGNKIPGGWGNQIKNDIVVNYRMGYEKQILKYRDVFALQASAALQLGSLFTNASISANATLGIIDAPFYSFGNRGKIKVYLYSQSVISGIGYDATLQGGVINNKSPYTISHQNIERFTAQFNYGLILKTRIMYFEYARTAITREFDSGNSAKWGGVKVGFTF